MSDYVYQPYPAWRFHPTKPAVIVDSEAEDKQLGKGWVDSHLKLRPEPEPEPPVYPAPGSESTPPTEPPPEASGDMLQDATPVKRVHRRVK